jgi:hypothetical protein
MSAPRRFLLLWLAVVAAAGVTIVVSQGLDLAGDGGDQLVAGPDGTVAPGTGEATTTTTGTVLLPAEGQTQVTGTVTAVHLVDAVLDPRTVAGPLTVVADPGSGNGAELSGVTVEGAAASVVWDGGRPFVLASGGLVLDPVVVDLTPEGLRLRLGGATHRLTPGTYELATPVAVGTSGVASARESVTFVADADSLFAATGDAALVLPPDRARRLVGPGTVRLEGALEITDADGTRAATTIDVATGAFDLTLTPVASDGWAVTAVLQGEVAAT